jgi:hypothetical protein
LVSTPASDQSSNIFSFTLLKFYDMTQYIVTLLLALGIIFATEQYENASQPEKQELQEKAGIIIEEVSF